MERSDRTKHTVLRGSPVGLEQGREYQAGYTLVFSNSNYYILKLWCMEHRSWYMSPNRDGSGSFTVFGKKVTSETGEVYFQNPVGLARPYGDDAHIEIVLPDFPRRYYMSLFPSN